MAAGSGPVRTITNRQPDERLIKLVADLLLTSEFLRGLNSSEVSALLHEGEVIPLPHASRSASSTTDEDAHYLMLGGRVIIRRGNQRQLCSAGATIQAKDLAHGWVVTDALLMKIPASVRTGQR